MKSAAMALEQDQRISEVVKREQFRLRNFIRRRVPDPRDVDDILQDVFDASTRLCKYLGRGSADAA
jgi:DNA-directed RNA polymerase specialized sigma24 family protein